MKKKKKLLAPPFFAQTLRNNRFGLFTEYGNASNFLAARSRVG